MTPIVSIVCAWYERADYVKESLESILCQNFIDFEFIVINDGSPNPKVQHELEAIEDERLIVIRQENSGFTRALNKAIELSRGKFIAIHGAGDVSKPTRIFEQVNYLEKNKEAVAVGSGFTQVSASHKFRRRYFPPDKVCSLETLKKNMPFTHGSIMYRKSALIKVGGYDIRFKYCSDWDLLHRLVKTGDVCSLPLDLYEQKIFSDGFSFSPQHKFKQIWFRERIINRGKESEDLLNHAELHINLIDETSPSYARTTLTMIIKSIGKFDFGNAKLWLNLLKQQSRNFFSRR